MRYVVQERISTMADGGRVWEPGMVLLEGQAPEPLIRSLLAEGLIVPEADAPVVEVEVEEVEVVEEEADDINITLKARQLAEGAGLDLADIVGTGQEGRITVDDVKGVLEQEEAEPTDELVEEDD